MIRKYKKIKTTAKKKHTTELITETQKLLIERKLGRSHNQSAHKNDSQAKEETSHETKEYRHGQQKKGTEIGPGMQKTPAKLS